MRTSRLTISALLAFGLLYGAAWADTPKALAQRLSNDVVGAGLAQFRLQGLDQRYQDLRLDLGLFDDGNAHRDLSISLFFHDYSPDGGNTQE